VRSSEGQTSACLLIVQLADQRDLCGPLWSRFFLQVNSYSDGRKLGSGSNTSK
jgi:hypothetical protein